MQVRFAGGSSKMTWAVYTIIHHPLSAERIEQTQGQLGRHPYKRGVRYWAEQGSTMFSMYTANVLHYPAGRPQCGDINGNADICFCKA